jgi:hypothetical protein
VKRVVWAGGVVVGLYAIVALAMLAWSGHVIRPLFEGVGPPPAYNWVKPPAQFASTNNAPKTKASDIPFKCQGPSCSTGAAVAATDDGQFVVNFADGSLTPHASDLSVHTLITPLDPAKLGPVPAGLAPDGNAYRIDLTYQPSGTSVGTLAVPGDVIMSAPHNAVALLYSADGQTWQKLASQAVGGPTTVGTSFSHAGYYVVAANPSSLGVQTANGSGGGGTLLIAIWVAAGAVVLGLIAWVVAGRRREARRRRGRQGQRRAR